jgi:hypothetical protein
MYKWKDNFIFLPPHRFNLTMFVISKSKSEKEVGKALELVVDSVNNELKEVDGLISDIDCDVSVGPIETSVSISVFLDGDDPMSKFLIGVNQKGYNRENSMSKAQKKVNNYLKDRGGKIVGEFVRTISILPERVYTTMIIAINENTIKDLGQLGTEGRRKRLKKGLELLGDDPSVINVARLATLFGVSRTMIYKDLEVLGYKRR